jgi:hypothetical protein
MSVIVYHGATEIVKNPICKIGRNNLDFGKGFYMTDIKEQAERWAKSVAFKRKADAIINKYELDRDAILTSARCKIFTDYNAEWLDFVVANRSGETVDKDFDYVEGGVADDRVIDTINLYMGGLLDMKVTLERLSQYQPSNQICILNQSLIDKYLHYHGYEIAK